MHFHSHFPKDRTPVILSCVFCCYLFALRNNWRIVTFSTIFRIRFATFSICSICWLFLIDSIAHIGGIDWYSSIESCALEKHQQFKIQYPSDIFETRKTMCSIINIYCVFVLLFYPHIKTSSVFIDILDLFNRFIDHMVYEVWTMSV